MSTPDPGSFRDPASRVVIDGDKVMRLLDERGLEGWRALSATDFFRKAVADGRLIDSVEIDPPEGSAGALRHPRLDLITYPYEWTFSMLRDAALLQLDLLEGALSAGLTIKDATPYNIQFVDGRPMFIDIGSFETYRQGEPWIGYRQFTRQFLFPLMLRAWVGRPLPALAPRGPGGTHPRPDVEAPRREEALQHQCPAPCPATGPHGVQDGRSLHASGVERGRIHRRSDPCQREKAAVVGRVPHGGRGRGGMVDLRRVQPRHP